MNTTTHLARDSKRLDVVSSLGLACAIVAVLAAAVSVAGLWPPRALVDDAAQVR